MRLLLYLVILSLAVYNVSSSSYFYGDMSNKLNLVHKGLAVYPAIPLKKRVKTYEYKGPSNLVIKAIHCYDMKNSDAVAEITEGGIGSNHFTVRLKSARGQKLDFEIEVYN